MSIEELKMYKFEFCRRCLLISPILFSFFFSCSSFNVCPNEHKEKFNISFDTRKCMCSSFQHKMHWVFVVNAVTYILKSAEQNGSKPKSQNTRIVSLLIESMVDALGPPFWYYTISFRKSKKNNIGLVLVFFFFFRST